MYAMELDRKSRSCSTEKVLLGLGEFDGRYHTPNWTVWTSAIRAQTSRACSSMWERSLSSSGSIYSAFSSVCFTSRLPRHGLEKVEDLEGVSFYLDIVVTGVGDSRLHLSNRRPRFEPRRRMDFLLWIRPAELLPMIISKFGNRLLFSLSLGSKRSGP